MNNIENNKIYKLGQLTLKAITILSAIIMVIRLFATSFVVKISWLAPYTVWRFYDWGVDAFVERTTFAMFLRLLISMAIVYGIYIVCYKLSKNNVFFMAIACGCFSIDIVLYIVGVIININTLSVMHFIGLVFKLLLATILVFATKYGFIGLRIEHSGRSFSPDVKYVNKSFSTELNEKKKIITFEREKSFFNSHIYLQIVIDGNTVGYLKDGETMEVEVDANQHTLYIVSHFAEIKTIRRSIPIGEENNSYLVTIEKEKKSPKKLEIYKK